MNIPTPNSFLDALPRPGTIAGPHNSAPGDLLLHLGEAWYPPAPAVTERLAAGPPDFSRYPDASCRKLRAIVAAYCGAGATADHVIIGNGSDGLIDLLACAFAGPQRPIAAPAPTFFAYGSAAIARGIPLLTGGRAGQDDGFVLDAESLLAGLPAETGVVFLANPNNPTGEMTPASAIARIAAGTRALVVVDECYYEFAGQTALELLAEHPNIVILRSLSKSFALAGLRVGYAVGHPAVIEAVARVDQTFTVNAVAQQCACTALQTLDYYRPLFAETAALREEWRGMLASRGLKVFPSAANILLADYSAASSENLAPLLKAHGVHVADFHARAGIKNAFRLAVGKREDLPRFDAALAGVLGYQNPHWPVRMM